MKRDRKRRVDACSLDPGCTLLSAFELGGGTGFFPLPLSGVAWSPP